MATVGQWQEHFNQLSLSRLGTLEKALGTLMNDDMFRNNYPDLNELRWHVKGVIAHRER